MAELKQRLNARHDRLNALACINHAQSYLEIGVASGTTFKKVEVARRVAVDPKFDFEVSSFRDEMTEFHEVTSDQYFSGVISCTDRFDLVYLDGLHTFEQTFRDFCALQRHSHQRTIWLIDDTMPVSWVSSLKSMSAASRIRRVTRNRNRAWYGDVYKVVFAIHEYFPQYQVATFSGHGQTVVWYEPREDFRPRFQSMKQIVAAGYYTLKSNIEVMNILEPNEVVERVVCGMAKVSSHE